MKKLILAALLCTATGAFAQKTNFSGSYKVNEEKVNWGPAPKYILPRYIKVEQLKDKIIIARTPLNQQLEEQAPVIDTISFDGTAFKKANVNGSKTSSSLKWSDEKSFMLTRTSINTDNEVTGTTTETWTLEDGGKTLFLDRNVDGRMKYNTKAYFTKQ